MARVLLKDLKKVYPNGFKAVHGINLEINDGEFMVFVGPSGCAKSTTLRMIAGLEDITKGQVWIGDQMMNHVAPKDRDIAMVFQNYALYPHMTAYENMAFVLRLRKIPKKEIDQRVKEAAEILEIMPLLNQKPKQMSGGQMQRVAVGRAIVRHPQVFLFDEPLSNLDAKLRVQMRVEISKLHKKLKTTMIYVTHDQVEAMTLGNRICVMEKGIIKQVDTPRSLYHYPTNIFVAQFIGMPAMNVVKARLLMEGNHYYIKTLHMQLRIPPEMGQKAANYVDKQILLGLRPEHITSRLSNKNAADNFYKTEIYLVENMGNDIYVYFTLGENQYIARLDPGIHVHPGDIHEVWFDTNFCHLFDKETGENILHRPKT